MISRTVESLWNILTNFERKKGTSFAGLSLINLPILDDLSFPWMSI